MLQTKAIKHQEKLQIEESKQAEMKERGKGDEWEKVTSVESQEMISNNLHDACIRAK